MVQRRASKSKSNLFKHLIVWAYTYIHTYIHMHRSAKAKDDANKSKSKSKSNLFKHLIDWTIRWCVCWKPKNNAHDELVKEIKMLSKLRHPNITT